MISIHALREEGDAKAVVELTRRYNISIHALREEGDPGRHQTARGRHHFYPRPPRGGRPAEVAAPRSSRKISIHALREEGDLQPPADDPQQQISIHALREEGDLGPF